MDIKDLEKLAELHDVVEEQILLSSCISDEDNLTAAKDIVRGRHFFLECHQMIFQSMVEIVNKGKSPTPLTLRNSIGDEEIFQGENMNLYHYLVKLSNRKLDFGSIEAIKDIAQTVANNSVFRTLIEVRKEYGF